MMLETTLSTTFTPGTNVKGQVAGANWSFLLPSLELERLLCFGLPPATTLATLSRLAHQVFVLCADARAAGKVREMAARMEVDNVSTLSGSTPLEALSDDSIDLILIMEWGSLSGDGGVGMLHEMRRLLKEEGVIYFEFGDVVKRLPDRQLLRKLTAPFGPPQMLWVTPLLGEMATAVHLQDDETKKHFIRRRLYSPSFNYRLLEKAERSLDRHPALGRLVRRYAVMAGGAATELASHPPRYLRTAAGRAGVNLAGYRWGLSARGRYNSRKVLLFLFAPDPAAPDYIVKMTRGGEFNRRLENEHRALTLLAQHNFVDADTFPKSAFFGHHGGLALLGQTIIDGTPLRRRTRATADCPYGRMTTGWLTRLGSASAEEAGGGARQVAAGLKKLYTRFLEIYRLSPEQTTFLHQQLGAIENSCHSFPLVMQHGDPGMWNAVVTREEKVAFLDWEAAESRGIPLWDLFYFLRSYCTWAARGQGIGDSLKAFDRMFLEDSPLSPFILEATGEYCEQVGLPPQLVEPLFYSCWMHRALKQATHLPPARLEKGHYVSLLRLAIDKRNAPTLRQLFAQR